MKTMSNRAIKIMAAAGLAMALGACASHKPEMIIPPDPVPVCADQRCAGPVPGAVEYIWEGPMVDVVEVPPGLDPEGHYYRPAHQEVVEIRQGRWRYYRPE